MLLLDGLWEKVDLVKVGVPLLKADHLSKIVFTTRNRKVCSLMEADKQFKVESLTDEEAWELFRRLNGVKSSLHAGCQDIARQISNKCDGLPLALVRVGQAMEGKQTLQEWIDVLQILTKEPSSISGSDDQLKKDNYYHLKPSYDNLQDDLFRTCFLYCCLYPRDHRICKRDLVDCWIGEGFLDDWLGVIQKQAYSIIDVLLDVCLLEEDEDDDYVKMQGWIHDMSLWILNEVEKEKRGLFVNHNLSSIFKSMCCLEPSKNIMQQISHSELSKLQHLDLSHSDIQSLPIELGVLRLKCLNLEHTSRLLTIPHGLISQFWQLLVLRLLECGVLCDRSRSTEDTVLCNDAQFLIDEVVRLKKLVMLSITLKNSLALEKFLGFYESQSCTQSLWLRFLRHPRSRSISLRHLKNLNALWISDCECLEELEVEYVRESNAMRGLPYRFHFLHQVVIVNCPNLLDLTFLILAPNIQHLEISKCSKFEEIISINELRGLRGCYNLIGSSEPFSKLKILKLSELPELRRIYGLSLPFPVLKNFSVFNCPKFSDILPPHISDQTEGYECGKEQEEEPLELHAVPSDWFAKWNAEPSALERKTCGLQSPQNDEAEVLRERE